MPISTAHHRSESLIKTDLNCSRPFCPQGRLGHASECPSINFVELVGAHPPLARQGTRAFRGEKRPILSLEVLDRKRRRVKHSVGQERHAFNQLTRKIVPSFSRNATFPSISSSSAGHSSGGKAANHALWYCSLRRCHPFFSLSRRQPGT